MRFPRSEAKKTLDKVIALLTRLPEIRYFICGSWRRELETVGDLDFLVIAANKDWEKIQELFLGLGLRISGGNLKMSYLVDGIRVDINRTNEPNLGAALCHNTGSKEENIRLRILAKKMGYELSQYGFRKISTGMIVPMAREEEVYAFLGEDYKNPEER